MAEFKYEITQQLGVLSESKSGWTREINLVSWNGAEPKFDIRDWAPEHEKMGKGISLSSEQLKNFHKSWSKTASARVCGGCLIRDSKVNL